MQEVRGSSPRATILLTLEDPVTFRLPSAAGAPPTGAFDSQTDSHRGRKPYLFTAGSIYYLTPDKIAFILSAASRWSTGITWL
jgi:hypothetical protein